MRILGIDPGIGTTGWSVVDVVDSQPRLVAAGTIQTNVSSVHAARLTSLFGEVTQLIQTYQPTDLAIERLFFAKNVTTAMRVSEARGVMLVAAALADLTIAEYTPLQVKLAVTGYGQASKRQISDMLRHHLTGATLPTQNDAADAIAVALTHSSSSSSGVILEPEGRQGDRSDIGDPAQIHRLPDLSQGAQDDKTAQSSEAKL